jgi:hypothetical protein
MKPLPIFKEKKSRRGKEMIIVDNTYQFNLKNVSKDKTKYYICTQYKPTKCKAYFTIKNNQIINYDNNHNHNPNELNTIKEEVRKKIKN